MSCRRLSILALAVLPAIAVAQPTPPADAFVTRIDLDSVDLAAVSTLSELLQGRVPGLSVRSMSGSVGSAAELLARGRKTVFGTDGPLLVVDGVRGVATARSFALDAGQSVSRLDDVPLAQIATVEVLRGPAATARFGAGASSGVILVTTRRSRGNQRSRSAFVDGGAAFVPATRLAGVVGVGTPGEGTPVCRLVEPRIGQCAQPTLVPFDPLASAPLSAAPRWRAGATAAAATPTAGWSVMADGERVGGVLAGNRSTRGSVRANVDARAASVLTLSAGAAASERDVALRPYDLASVAQPVFGFNAPFPTIEGTPPYSQRARRLDASATATWRAASWIDARLTVGTSVVDAREERPPQVLALDPTRYNLAPGETGVTVREWRGADHDRVTTAALALTMSRRLGALTSATTLGAEDLSVVTQASARTPGITTWQTRRLGGQAVLVGERADLGPFRADASARVDRDRDAADHRRAVDASASLLWRTVRRGDFALDLHAAIGDVTDDRAADVPLITLVTQTGVVTQAQRQYVPPRPRTREGEFGAHVTLRRSFDAELTAYRQRVDGVLVFVPAAPSLGVSATLPMPSTVRNDGVEAVIRARPVERSRLGVALTVSAWGNRNRLASYGEPRPDFAPNLGLSTKPGYPLRAYWAVPFLGFTDADGNGVIVPSEVRVGSLGTYAGTADASRGASAEPTVRIGRRLTLRAVVEYRGGMVGDAAHPTDFYGDARGAYDHAAPLDEQARIVAMQRSNAFQVENATFTRLREFSMTTPLPKFFGVPGAALTVGGRNLVTWTHYSGSDPEVDQSTQPTLAQPLPPTLVVRLTSRW